MPTVREIEQALFELAPREGAMDWDNVGHLLGDPDSQVSRVLVALDITEDVADEALAHGCELIVAHHPLMNCRWLPVQSIREDTQQGHLLRKLLRHDICAICMHTNLDVAWGGVNDALAEALELRDTEPLCENGLGRVGTLPQPMSLVDFARFVSQRLGCNGLRYADAGKPVHRVAVGGGACGEYMDLAIAAGCDTFVTADVKYNQFWDAQDLGLNLIDAGHFATENPVVSLLAGKIAAQFPEVCVKISETHRDCTKFF